MRIIAGTHRSRVIKTLEGNQTRPTADKVKGAVFSKLGAYFDGGEMLDLFSGSGNMGLEAISRGMKHVVFNDVSRDAIRIIKENIKQFQMETSSSVLQLDFATCLKRLNGENKSFDLIFVDPPYALGKMTEIFTMIDAYALLKEDGILVVESDKKDRFEDIYGSLYKEKEVTYGASRISYYRKKGE